jgi:glycopeptide antibiotics resistance protein
VLRVIIWAVAFVALVGFAIVLAELTLTPSPASAQIAGSNLRPGHSLRQYAEDYTFLAACKQVGGNLVMGAPFGLILPVLISRRLRMVRVVVLTAVVMVLVELAQGLVVEGRAFDVDDVILNTSGALIAYLLLGRRVGRRFHALGDPVAAPRNAGRNDDRDERKPAAGGRSRWARAVPKPAFAQRTTAKRTTAKRTTAKPTTMERLTTKRLTTKRVTTAKPATTTKRVAAKSQPAGTRAKGSAADAEPSWSERLGRLARSRR